MPANAKWDLIRRLKVNSDVRRPKASQDSTNRHQQK